MLLELDSSFFKNYIFCGVDNNRKIIHEDIQNKQNLLVTIGDSWTWGDSIDGIHATVKPDSPKRLESVYGKKIKDQLIDYDWINLAYPGTGNRWIVDTALRFVNLQTQLDYKKIIIICLLSDSTRDTEYAIRELKIKFETMIELYKAYEKLFLTQLSVFDSIDNINLVVARNFTNTHTENLQIVKNHLPDNWVEFSRANWSVNEPKIPDFIGYGTAMTNEKFWNYEQKQWFLEVNVPVAENLTNFLTRCPLHYKIASKHPTEENHQLWANHLVKYMSMKQIV